MKLEVFQKEKIFKRCQSASWSGLVYLGHIVGEGQLSTQPESKAIVHWNKARNVTVTRKKSKFPVVRKE